MEQHDTDPTAPDDGDPWKSVAEQFGALGGHLKETYQRVSEGRGPSEDEIKGAFDTLGDAWGRIADSLTTAMRDPETRQRVKSAASSLADALGTTLSELGEEIDSEKPDEEE